MKTSLNNILDRKVVTYLGLFFLVALFISTVSAIIGKLEGLSYTSYSWGQLFINLIVRYVSKFIFIFSAILLVRFLFLKKYISNSIRIVLHFIFAISLSFYSVLIQTIASNLLDGGNDPITFEYIYSSAIFGTDYNFFLYFCMIAIVYAYYFFQKQKDYELKESNLKAQLLDSKINALQSQLQPHFLFNALNDISSLIDESTEKSQDAIADLSDLLRSTLAIKDTKFITIAEEIALLKKYLDIEKLRFQNNLNFHISVPNELLKMKMPPLLLQPIVENSIKHGFSYEHDSINILIKIVEENQCLAFYISNNGKALDDEIITYGNGIHNVISRLSTLFEEDFEFEMKNNDTLQVITNLKIPITL